MIYNIIQIQSDGRHVNVNSTDDIKLARRILTAKHSYGYYISYQGANLDKATNVRPRGRRGLLQTQPVY